MQKTSTHLRYVPMISKPERESFMIHTIPLNITLFQIKLFYPLPKQGIFPARLN